MHFTVVFASEKCFFCKIMLRALRVKNMSSFAQKSHVVSQEKKIGISITCTKIGTLHYVTTSFEFLDAGVDTTWQG